MEMETSPIKQKRYDLSMSKRTRRTNSSKIAAEVNTGGESLLGIPPVTSEEKKEAEQVLNVTSDNKAILQETVFAPIISEEEKQAEQVISYIADNKFVVKETVFAPATPRPSLKELIQVTNKEERNATEVTKRSLVTEKASQEEKETLPNAVVQQCQIVKGVRSPGPGVVRRCAKALNQMVKVRYAPKQKSVVPLTAM